MTLPNPEMENQTPAQPVQTRDTSSETNLRKLAKALETERESNQKMQQELTQLREASQRSRDQDSDDGEPYVDQKRLSKELNRFAEDWDKKFDRKVEEKASMMIERERQQAFLKNNPDFNQIMNDEAVLNKLAERHPDIVEPLLQMPDNFARQKLVYQNIKALGVHKPDAPKTSIQDKVDANRRSPYYQPSSASSTPPYGFQGDFSKGGQKNAYQKMQDLINAKRF